MTRFKNQKAENFRKSSSSSKKREFFYACENQYAQIVVYFFLRCKFDNPFSKIRLISQNCSAQQNISIGSGCEVPGILLAFLMIFAISGFLVKIPELTRNQEERG